MKIQDFHGTILITEEATLTMRPRATPPDTVTPRQRPGRPLPTARQSHRARRGATQDSLQGPRRARAPPTGRGWLADRPREAGGLLTPLPSPPRPLGVGAGLGRGRPCGHTGLLHLRPGARDPCQPHEPGAPDLRSAGPASTLPRNKPGCSRRPTQAPHEQAHAVGHSPCRVAKSSSRFSNRTNSGGKETRDQTQNRWFPSAPAGMSGPGWEGPAGGGPDWAGPRGTRAGPRSVRKAARRGEARGRREGRAPARPRWLCGPATLTPRPPSPPRSL